MTGDQMRRTLAKGQRVYGAMLALARNPRWARVLAGTGLDYVIIDTATVFDETLIAAYQSSDRLVVVATPIMPALKDARILFNALSGEGYSMEQVILVLNQVDKSSNITADQIGNFLKHEVAAQIPTDPMATGAVNQGTPLVTMDPRRTIAVRPLMELVQIVQGSFEREMAEEAVDQSQARGRGLFGGGRR